MCLLQPLRDLRSSIQSPLLGHDGALGTPWEQTNRCLIQVQAQCPFPCWHPAHREVPPMPHCPSLAQNFAQLTKKNQKMTQKWSAKADRQAVRISGPLYSIAIMWPRNRARNTVRICGPRSLSILPETAAHISINIFSLLGSGAAFIHGPWRAKPLVRGPPSSAWRHSGHPIANATCTPKPLPNLGPHLHEARAQVGQKAGAGRCSFPSARAPPLWLARRLGLHSSAAPIAPSATLPTNAPLSSGLRGQAGC